MKITTKYDEGDLIWTIHRSKAHRGRISAIAILVKRKPKITYTVIFRTVDLGHGEYPESVLFRTKDELIESL